MASPAQLAALKAVVPAAQASAAKTGVPASVTLAQWIVESSWGMSRLSILANNFFGIKAVHRDVPNTYVEMPTAEYESGARVLVMALFRKFASEEECFEAHAALLAHSARYTPAMLVSHIPTAFAAALQKCGYSTSPVYAQMLCELMRDYSLTQYDTPPPSAAAQEKAA